MIQVADAFRWPRTCKAEVTRRSAPQPCGLLAVGFWLDPAGGEPYPLCLYHARSEMVPLEAEAAS